MPLVKRKKPDPSKPDDLFIAGPVKWARYGNVAIAEKHVSPESHEATMRRIAAMHPTVVADIDRLVREVADEVVKYDPVRLLTCSYWKASLTSIGKTAEPDFTADDGLRRRMIDYVQCLVAAVPPRPDQTASISERQWERLFEKVSELFRKLNVEYHIGETALKHQAGELDLEYEQFYVRAQMYWANVRGARYVNHDVQHVRDLMVPHDDILKRQFGIGAEAFVHGIDRIIWSLTQGLDDAAPKWFLIRYEYEEYLLREGRGDDPAEAYQRFLDARGLRAEAEVLNRKMLADGLFEVSELTGFPISLLRELSWEPGEDRDFFAEGPMAGWPLRIQPINVRPFLKVGERYYCFDVYSLLDKIYRVMQKIFTRREPTYGVEWKEKQQAISEALPVDLLSRILPGCQVFRSVYYKDGKTTCESDALVTYDQSLFVIEVKAASFTYTSPTTDFKAYMESIKTLILKPTLQARRLIQRLETDGEVKLFDGPTLENQIGLLRQVDFTQIVPCSVTLDNMMHLAAQAENLKVLGADFDGFPVWAMSVDDLRVYADLFRSPTQFLHFVRQRMKAVKSKSLTVTDELDHIGMFLDHNDYAKYAENFHETHQSDVPIWVGYSKRIDEYYSQLLTEPEKASPPAQACPTLISDIIAFLEHERRPGHTQLGLYLLSMNERTRFLVQEGVQRSVKRQGEIHMLCPVNFFDSDAALTVMCKNPNTVCPTDRDARNYCLGAMISDNQSEWLELTLTINDQLAIRRVEWKFFTAADIDQDNRDLVTRHADHLASVKAREPVPTDERRKVGRNEPCHCGSTLKFKKCHGAPGRR